MHIRYSDWPPSHGKVSQRGRYLCDRVQSSIGGEVAIGSAAVISKVAISNVHCIWEAGNDEILRCGSFSFECWQQKQLSEG